MKAIVTGASSGIGRDMAIYLGKLGMLLKFTKTNKVRITILCKIKWDNTF